MDWDGDCQTLVNVYVESPPSTPINTPEAAGGRLDPEKRSPYIPGVVCASHRNLPLSKACVEKNNGKKD